MKQSKETASPAAEFLSVSKSYGSVAALCDVSFTLRRGETVGLLGRNGAGKTTTLNLLTGYLTPSSGTVRIAGEDMKRDPAFCKRRIGYLPERPPLYDEMTVTEYLRFVCDLRMVLKKARAAHVAEILERCGLKEVQHRLLGHLSGGYRQRAGLAQALCGNPPLLILDEPTVSLDPAQTVEIRGLIARLSRDHTILFSSHLLPEVQQLCSRVLILQEGKLILDQVLRETEASGEHPGETGEIRLRLCCDGEPETVRSLLSARPWIRALQPAPREEAQPDKRPAWILTLAPGVSEDEGTERLFRLLAETDHVIRSLYRERDSLEELFLRLTN